MKEKITIVLLIIIGILINYFSFFSNKNLDSLDIFKNYQLDSNFWSNIKKIKIIDTIPKYKHNIKVLIIMQSSACSPCINEVVEYCAIIKSKWKINPEIIITNSNMENSVRFIKILNKELNFSWYDIKYLKKYKFYKDGNFIIFINKKLDMVFYLRVLPNSIISSLRNKEKVLRKALALNKRL